MNKDNFYYVLKDRLEYAHDYVKDSSAFLTWSECRSASE